MTESTLEELINAEAEHAEQNMDAQPTPDTVITRPGHARSTVFSVRLNPDEAAALQAYANDAGLPASTLVRSWIIDRLRGAGPSDALRTVVREEVRAAVREELAGHRPAG
ncbi:hypothetical protein [Tomitella gaofuii]|uniref:hypothetical protein n=1 Tax=Tomitella gaofuii TaxID=2760083 RepID=UPI0015FB880A|nr:hypothetical protein [Tomitella gaofuii]